MSESYQPQLGDRVVIHDPKLAAQLGRADQLAVIINLRRSGARLAFLPERSTVWVDDHRIFPHPRANQISSAELSAVSTALTILRPEEAEIEEGPRGLEVHALCLRFGEEHRAAMVARLGAALDSWEIIPYGMALITVVIRLCP